MLVYSTTITPRLQYVIDFCSQLIASNGVSLTNDKEKFLQSTGCKVNYSDEKIGGELLQIFPHALLFEKNIQQQEIDCFVFQNRKAFFKTGGDFPFDIWAAIFYCISRYEEYLPHEKDEYGRYAYQQSIAYKEDFLQIPLVNYWLQELVKALQNKFSDYKAPDLSFSFLPTYDIDEAFAYNHKGFLRNVGGAARDFFRRKWDKLKLRYKVLRQQLNDPYNSFEWIDAINEKYQLQPVYFFLMAQRKGKFDKNFSPQKQVFQKILKAHVEKYKVGIHPSWQSGDTHSLLEKEIKILEKITDKNITNSRQHYIRFTLPDSFRRLLKAGITNDFSMGYGSINGFRASVASPFYWYDLEREEQTKLQLHPFCIMEANSFYEERLSASEAFAEMKSYLQEVKNVNGTFISIWHNTFLGIGTEFSGWKEMYEEFVKEVTR